MRNEVVYVRDVRFNESEFYHPGELDVGYVQPEFLDEIDDLRTADALEQFTDLYDSIINPSTDKSLNVSLGERV